MDTSGGSNVNSNKEYTYILDNSSDSNKVIDKLMEGANDGEYQIVTGAIPNLLLSSHTLSQFSISSCSSIGFLHSYSRA